MRPAAEIKSFAIRTVVSHEATQQHALAIAPSLTVRTKDALDLRDMLLLSQVNLTDDLSLYMRVSTCIVHTAMSLPVCTTVHVTVAFGLVIYCKADFSIILSFVIF